MVVLEGELVLPLLRHIHPHGCLTDAFTVRLVCLQQVLSAVAVQAALAEVLSLSVLALIIEQAVEAVYQSEVGDTILLG